MNSLSPCIYSFQSLCLKRMIESKLWMPTGSSLKQDRPWNQKDLLVVSGKSNSLKSCIHFGILKFRNFLKHPVTLCLNSLHVHLWNSNEGILRLALKRHSYLNHNTILGTFGGSALVKQVQTIDLSNYNRLYIDKILYVHRYIVWSNVIKRLRDKRLTLIL